MILKPQLVLNLHLTFAPGPSMDRSIDSYTTSVIRYDPTPLFACSATWAVKWLRQVLHVLSTELSQRYRHLCAVWKW